MARAEAPLSKLPWMANHLTNRRERPTSEGTVIVYVFVCTFKALANGRGSYPLADMETSNNTLDQVHTIFIG